MRRPLAAVLVPLLSLPLAAQIGNGLTVRPDPDNVVANSLPGEWRVDETLQKRLGSRGAGRLVFRADETVVARIPGKLADALRERRLYLAGVMTLRGKDQPFVLTELSGNPTVVWFRERDGDPLGDAESFTVVLVRAEARPADLLFVGGDSNDQSFAPYARETKAVGKLEPAAAITEMLRLLEAGKAREFVETWCAPEDLAKAGNDGKTIEKLAERFTGERGQELIEILNEVGKRPPVMDASGDVASWDLDRPGAPRKLRLQRIDGRWYLRNR